MYVLQHVHVQHAHTNIQVAVRIYHMPYTIRTYTYTYCIYMYICIYKFIIRWRHRHHCGSGVQSVWRWRPLPRPLPGFSCSCVGSPHCTAAVTAAAPAGICRPPISAFVSDRHFTVPSVEQAAICIPPPSQHRSVTSHTAFVNNSSITKTGRIS